MIVCSCNIVTENEIRSVITDLLNNDPWQLIVPAQVYHEMGKRGRCCGCFPRLVDLIVDTTQDFHRDMQSDEEVVIQFISRLKDKHQQCETARMLARHRIAKTHAA
ncbi:MAG: (2Fe-2S)-binding protein [Rhizobiaceae bacterium]|nr:(2Fe-2S)-binding protein [Rhizobiaceae bacterium]